MYIFTKWWSLPSKYEPKFRGWLLGLVTVGKFHFQRDVLLDEVDSHLQMCSQDSDKM
jgi:hypothetical protein